MWYFWVVKPMLQGYLASCVHIFSFMATWKCDSFNSRSKFKVHAKRPNSRPGSKVKVKHERHIAWAHFVHLGALKIHLLPSLETQVQGYVDRCELIFCILAAWKCDFCRVVKPMLQGNVASCEHIFSFMATWKCDSFKSWSCEKTKFAARIKGQGQTRMTHRLSSLRAFLRLENTFTAEFWNSHSRVHSFVRTHFLHFGGFKMWFFRVVKPMLQGYVASCEHTSSIMTSWKCDSFNSMSNFKGHAKRPNSLPG